MLNSDRWILVQICPNPLSDEAKHNTYDILQNKLIIRVWNDTPKLSYLTNPLMNETMNRYALNDN